MRVDTDQNQEDREQAGGLAQLFRHLEEFRRRLIHSLIAVAVAFGICWFAVDRLFRWVAAPIRKTGVELITLTATEAFNVELKLALLASIFLAAPFIFGQLWLFISARLPRSTRRHGLSFILSSSVLFLSGGVFAYVVALPFLLQYLMNWMKHMTVTPRISAGEYLSVFIMVELGLSIIFEIPALIFLLSRLGVVSGPFLLRNTRYAVLVAFIVAAVITPPDVISQAMVALPMIGLYLLGVIVAYVFARKPTREPGN